MFNKKLNQMIYDKIHDFCKVRNNGNCFKNGSEPTPRVRFLMDLLDKEGIEYELDIFEEEKRKPIYIDDWFETKRSSRRSRRRSDGKRKPNFDLFRFLDDKVEENEPTINKFFNIIMKGTSNKMIVAHHDVNNHTTDNANDNSASCINVIATKKLRPELNVILLDGEEFGGIGSKRAAKQINEGKFGSIQWVLNFELTGKGGEYFFIGNYPGKLSDRIKSIFNCPVVNTPFNDSINFRSAGIDSVVINPIPPLPEGQISSVVYKDQFLDISMLHNCHSAKDNIASISTKDMKEFVEKVILKIV